MMKNIKVYFLLLVFAVFISCIPRENKSNKLRKVATASLLGKWNLTTHNHSKHQDDEVVESFQILNDSMVDLQIIDKGIKKKITGKWTNGYKFKKKGVLEFEINSDIKIIYSLNSRRVDILLLELGKEKGKIVMTTYHKKFVKE